VFVSRPGPLPFQCRLSVAGGEAAPSILFAARPDSARDSVDLSIEATIDVASVKHRTKQFYLLQA